VTNSDSVVASEGELAAGIRTNPTDVRIETGMRPGGSSVARSSSSPDTYGGNA
jgi:hypothetical protein